MSREDDRDTNIAVPQQGVELSVAIEPSVSSATRKNRLSNIANAVKSAVRPEATTLSAADHALHDDLKGIKGALENHLEFQYLAPETQPLLGLQDWSGTRWKEAIAKNPGLAAVLASSLLPDNDVTEDPTELALKIKDRIREALPTSKWRSVVAFQNAVLNHLHTVDEDAQSFYITGPVLSHALFNRDFPLGIDKRVAAHKWRFIVENSGLSEVRHRESKLVTYSIGVIVAALGCALVGYFLNYTVNRPDNWTMDATLPASTADINRRTKERGRIASIIQSVTFSALVNSSLDKIGKIDPATSTVLIGMFLGNTFGFILDLMLGSDEGLREYLWSPSDGMRYALGSLASDRFGRFFVTVLFDMFFTVILFKHFYSMLVHVAGFSQNGREWIANFVVSGFISVITFVVYANLTRFQWAYPSGVEEVTNQWIAGPTMLLATVIMNMVYLTSETRVRIEEPGINDPPVKLAITMITFFILYALQSEDILDPSETPRAQNVTADYNDINLPLKKVCAAQSNYLHGVALLSGIALVSLGGVIFGTSQQTLLGVLAEVRCCSCGRRGAAAAKEPSAKEPSAIGHSRASVRASHSTVSKTVMSAVVEAPSKNDRLQGMACLYVSYLGVIVLLMLFFSYTPFASHNNQGVPRNTSLWREACDNNDVQILDLYGLS